MLQFDQFIEVFSYPEKTSNKLKRQLPQLKRKELALNT